MKRYMIMCMAIVALLFASCKNEDISISREVTFNVNPYTVVKDFAKHEYNHGDMETPYPGDRVCVNLFIYDNNGHLFDSKREYFRDYTESMLAKMELPDGQYTIVAVTCCVESNYNEYWLIKGEERLTNLQISYNEDNDYWHSYWDILGITSQQIIVSAGHDVYDIDVKPAGSLVLNHIQDIHYYNNVYYYVLYGNRNDISYSFNATGTFTCNSVEDSYFPQAVSPTIDPEDFQNYAGVARYAFLPAAGRTAFRWEALIEDPTVGTVYGAITDEKTLDIQPGKIFQTVFTVSTMDFSVQELRDGERSEVSNVSVETTECKQGLSEKPMEKQK